MTDLIHHGAQWYRDEEYRQSVIRKALLLGFSAVENKGLFANTMWSFTLQGKIYGYYTSCYSAAYGYLRLIEQEHLAGEYKG
jgi:hypothetical protein